MECENCYSYPNFHCFYENIDVCTVHIGEHMLSNHPYEKLEMFPCCNEELKKKLDTMIYELRNLEIFIISETSNLIQTIEENSRFLLIQINHLIAHYQRQKNLKSLSRPQLEKIESISDIVFKINQFTFSDLQEAVKLKYFKISKETELYEKSRKRRFLERFNGGFKCLALTSDGQTLITGSQDTSVRLWDLNSKSQVACLLQHNADVLCLSITSTNQLVASGSIDKTIVVWDIYGKNFLKVLRGHSEAVNIVNFNSNSDLIVSGSSSNEIFLWNVQSGEIINKCYTGGIVRCGLIYEDLFFAGINNFFEIWELKSLKRISRLKAHKSLIRSIAVSITHKLLITCSNDTLIKARNIGSLKLYSKFTGHTKKVTSVTVFNSLIISASEDKSIIIWNIDLKKEIHRFSYHEDHIYGVIAFNDLIFSASRDSRIGISRISSQSLETFMNLQRFQTPSEVFKNDFIAFGSLNDVILFNFSSINEVVTLKGHSGQVKAVCISSNMNLMLSSSSGSKDNLIIWDLKSKSLKSFLRGHENKVLCLDISKNEKFGVSGDSIGKVILWDLVEIKKEFIFEGHSGVVYSVKFSGNFRYFASGGNDKGLLLWDLFEKVCVCSFEGHKQTICKIFSTDDDKYFVSADKFDGIKVWNIGLQILEFSFRDLSEAKGWIQNYRYLKEGLTRYLF